MDFLPDPSRRPTPSEYAVILVGASALLIGLGLVGFGCRIFATPSKPQAAAALTYLSGWLVVIGALIGFVYWLYRRLTD